MRDDEWVMPQWVIDAMTRVGEDGETHSLNIIIKGDDVTLYIDGKQIEELSP